MSAGTYRPCVLVVDDEPLLLAVLVRMLSKAYRVVSATDLNGAIRHLESGQVDVLLTDLRLQGGERGETLIERFGARLPCLAMTAFGEPELEREVRRLGAVDYLSKPFGSAQLHDAVVRALGERDAPLTSPKGGGPDPRDVGLVLSGGGMAGAYEAGVLQGIIEVLGRQPTDPPPFRTFVGTSAGAINATWLAAHAHQGDLNVDGLVALWSSMAYRQLVQIDWKGFLLSGPQYAMLQLKPLEGWLRGAFDWRQVTQNLQQGLARALILSSFDLGRSQSTLFVSLAPGARFGAPPGAHIIQTRITPEHVLAASVVPGLFRPQRLGQSYYINGGFQYRLPAAPAIRLGVSHLVAVSSLLANRESLSLGRPPGFVTVMWSVVLGGLFDAMQRDVERLHHYNALWEILEQELSAEQLARVSDRVSEQRGLAYRRVQTLLLTSRGDLALRAHQFLERELGALDLPRVHRFGLRQALQASTGRAAWAPYLVWDGTLGRELAAQGREDALARKDDIRAFFRSP